MTVKKVSRAILWPDHTSKNGLRRVGTLIHLQPRLIRCSRRPSKAGGPNEAYITPRQCLAQLLKTCIKFELELSSLITQTPEQISKLGSRYNFCLTKICVSCKLYCNWSSHYRETLYISLFDRSGCIRSFDPLLFKNTNFRHYFYSFSNNEKTELSPRMNYNNI